jgi:hypothetical protein
MGGACVALPPCACPDGPTSIALVGGGTVFHNGGGACLSPCASQADCGCGEVCAVSFTLCRPGTPVTTCESVGLPPGAYCASVVACQPPA